jgi:DNA repair exonuclease SbcCD ATPase subunit
VARLDVGERFPVRMRWNAALVPLAGIALAAVIFFYDPTRTQATTSPGDEGKQPVANKEEVEKKIDEAKKKALTRKKAEKVKPEQGDPFDDELQKILAKKHETQEEVRDRFKEVTELKEKIKKDQDDLKDRAQAMKDQLQQLNKNAGSDTKDGPAKEMQKALEKGDFKKAREELEKLRKKMEDKDNPLTDKEKEQLQKQIQGMKEQMKRATNPEEAKQALEQLKRDGKIDQEQFDKAMQRINKNAEKMSKSGDKEKLEQLGDALKEAEQALKDGNSEKASDALKRAGDALRKSDELTDLQENDQEQLDQLEDIQRAMRQGMGPGIGSGRRPESEAHQTSSYTSKLKGQHDNKGAQELTGYAPGTSFKKKTSAEIAGEVKEASQDAPGTIDQQRIPRSDRDMARGYFENIRKLSSDDEKKDK